MAFVYAPVLLFVSSTGFDLLEFSYTSTSCIAGVIALSAAVVGYWLSGMTTAERILAALAGLIFIAPSWQADIAALMIVAPVVIFQLIKKKQTSIPA